jgi:hypothetical protein
MHRWQPAALERLARHHASAVRAKLGALDDPLVGDAAAGDPHPSGP